MSARPRLALVTCERLPALFGDEQELPARLAAAGVDAQPVIWSDAAVDWRSFDHIVIRSTWDYFERLPEFRAWLDRIDAAGTPVSNPTALLRWNLDKHYLRELSERGVETVPTRFVDAPAQLTAILEEAGWDQAVLKPTVSGGSWHTHRVDRAQAAALQDELDLIVRQGGAMVQPFVPEIVDEGEWSFFFFDGALSHVVLKTPKASDFRVQTQFGATYAAALPTPEIATAAAAVLPLLPLAPVYARIDGVRRGNRFAVMEVEVVEPYLFLPAAPGATDRYVATLVALVSQR